VFEFDLIQVSVPILIPIFHLLPIRLLGIFSMQIIEYVLKRALLKTGNEHIS